MKKNKAQNILMLEKNVVIAVFLSLVPGVPYVYLGKAKKAIGLFVMDLVIIALFLFSDGYIAKILAIYLYGMSVIFPGIESYQIARYGTNTLEIDSYWYITLMLLTTGFNALPLLWISRKYTLKGKVVWTAMVTVLALLFFTFLAKNWAVLEEMAEGLLSKS